MRGVRSWWRRYIRDSRAVSALEYAILVGVIAVAVAAALATFGQDLTKGIEKIGDQVADPGPEDLDL